MTRVLMVETDAGLISAIGRALARYEVEVASVDRIERAGELTRQQEFSLLLIDSNLVSARDLDAFAGTPIVITAAFLERDPAERFSRAARVLQKPFTSAELSHVLTDELGLTAGEDTLLDVLTRGHLGLRSFALHVGEGELILENGELVHAAIAEKRGEAALVEILAKGGAVTRGSAPTGEHSIRRPFQALLFDALAFVEQRDRLDEYAARLRRHVRFRSLPGGRR